MYLSDRRIDNLPVATSDINSLIQRKIPEISKKNIASYLLDSGFTHVYKDLDNPATEAYVKEIDGFEVEIEFLTDSSVRNDKYSNVIIAGVVAQSLSYLTLSLQTTLEFQTYSGVMGKVVAPGAWMFHKGLTFTKRKNTLKVLKDLYGIWYVASQLGNFSENAICEFIILSKEYPKWFSTIKRNFANWSDSATPDVWFKLEMQDPSGKLKKLNFLRIIKLFDL